MILLTLLGPYLSFRENRISSPGTGVGPFLSHQTCHPVVGTGISGGGGEYSNGIRYCRNSGKEGRGFHFCKIDRDFN